MQMPSQTRPCRQFGWSSKNLQNLVTTLHAKRAEMLHATKLVVLDRRGGQLSRPICISTICEASQLPPSLSGERASRPPPQRFAMWGWHASRSQCHAHAYESPLGQVPGTCGPYSWTLRMLSATSTVRPAWRWFLNFWDLSRRGLKPLPTF